MESVMAHDPPYMENHISSFCRLTKGFIFGGGAMSTNRRYGFGNFLFDLIMICLTAGLWLIWIFVREMRRQY